MQQIDATTVMVDTPGDLSLVLTGVNDYTLIYLGADIVLDGLIIVNTTKREVTIDGFYPLDGTGTQHRLSDSGDDLGQIYISEYMNIHFTFRNLTIPGRNYFGILRAYDTINTQNLEVTFRNVTYEGPQIIWNPWGITNFFDCDITIQEAERVAHEVGEVNRLVIGGRNVIKHGSTTRSVFFIYKANGSFTLLDDSVLEVTSQRSFIQREFPIPITIGKRAVLMLTTEAGFSHDGTHQMGNILIDEDAVFRHIRNTNSVATHSMIIGGAFTVNRGASVYMQAAYTQSGSLMRFTSSSASLNLNCPKSFAIYKNGTVAGARAMSFTATISYNFETGQINQWETATQIPAAGTLDDVAPGRWHKANWERFFINGSASSSATSIGFRTITDEEITEQGLTPISNMHLRNARVFSAGCLPLEINRIVNDGRPVTGHTESGANVRVERTVGSTGFVYNSTADEDGNFSVQTAEQIEIGDEFLISSNTPFLIVTKKRLGVGPGELALKYVPPQITFESIPLTTSPDILLKRTTLSSGEQDPVIIIDTRDDKTPWELWARITRPLQTDDGKHVLRDAVVFAMPDGTLETMDYNLKLIYEAGPYPEDETSITWDENRGFLARITGPMRSGVAYRTHVIWQLRPAGQDGISVFPG